jgi:hypothetical protein
VTANLQDLLQNFWKTAIKIDADVDGDDATVRDKGPVMDVCGWR